MTRAAAIGWVVFWVCAASISASQRSWVSFAIAAGFLAFTGTVAWQGGTDE